MPAKKKYFTVNLIHKACQILSTFINQCHSFHFCSQCLRLPGTLNIPILLTAIPQHIVNIPVHCIGYIARLKTLHTHFW